MKPAIIILLPELGQDGENHPVLLPFLGSSLLERHIRFAKKFGASRVSVVSDSADDTVLAKEFLSERDVGEVELIIRGNRHQNIESEPGNLLLLWAEYLVEEPILRSLVDNPSACALVDQAATDDHEVAGAATVLATSPEGWLDDLIDGEQIPKGVVRLNRNAFAEFNPGLRRHRRSGWLKIESESDLSAAKAMLIDGSQKGSLDIPAKYLHAPIENAIVGRIAETSITPNQITVYTTAAAWVMTWLMLTGHVWAGLAGAAVIGILDGVDGKLARLKLMTSRLGEMEHLLDMMFEYSWWLALGWTLSGGDSGSPLFWMSIGLILCNFGDTLAGVLFWVFRGRAVGRTIDNYTPFDLRFRLIGGRRNIYIWLLLLLGPLVGLENAFTACFGWAVVTVLIRMSRALLHIARPTDENLENFVVY